jgi:predicted outer membrane repeat protein
MKSFLVLAILSTVICVSVSASAASWYVDGSVSSSGDGTSWETALKTIQEGIDKALEGDTVTVAEGAYIENIQLKGKNIVLTSTDPLDPSVIANTIIDGNQAGSVVTFSGTETEACVLCGFTIRNGLADDGAGIWGGGDPYTHAAIQKNTVTENSAQHRGGGLFSSDGTIQNNTITGNSAGYAGGGLAGCAGTIQNNTIMGNSAQWIGGGLSACEGLIRNCIVWGNTARTNPQVDESSIPSYSCIEGWTGGGEGNTAWDPRFLDLNAGDYRLQEGSPCIDAGYNAPELPETDIAGMHRIMFGGKSLTVDMGAYEFHIWPPTENIQTGEITLKWSSLAGKTYSVYHSGDMLVWDVLADNVPSAGNTVTTWIDPIGSASPPGVRIRYYKVMENQ